MMGSEEGGAMMHQRLRGFWRVSQESVVAFGFAMVSPSHA
jgi:hypothetical protein